MRRRILLLVIGVTTLVVLAFAIPIAILTRIAVAQNADTRTKDQARNIAFVLRSLTPTTARLQALVDAQASDTERGVQIVTVDGTAVTSTTAAFPKQSGQNPLAYPRTFPSGSTEDTGGIGAGAGGTNPGTGLGAGGSGPIGGQVEFRPVSGGQIASTPARAADGTVYFVRVYMSDGLRYSGTKSWYLLIALGSLGLLLVGVGAGEVLTRRITRPLLRTAETAQQLSVGDTTARAPTEGPREVADVGKALNRLADRIDELIAEERETVADLSHRLRTPLTSLRLDAEALRDPVDSERVGAHVSELERTLTAVIHAARRPQREGRMPSCDATDVVGERVEFWSALTDEQGRHCDIELPSVALPVRAAAGDLAAAVDALIENVVAHTDEGTSFAVRLTGTDAGARLEISDDGPGIPDEAEVRGRSDRGSTGLGLDIARRCAEATGGSMTIDRTAAGGARVVLQLHTP